MPAPHVLSVTAHGLNAWSRVGNTLEDRSFTLADKGLFMQWLDEHQGAEFCVLADVADEIFHLETLPAVHLHERRSVLKRRLRQRFSNTSLSLAHVIAPTKTRNEKRNVLLSALSDSAPLKPWLDILQTQNTFLTGIYTPSLLLPRLLVPPTSQRLVVTFGRGGMRQSLIQGDCVIFSRLFPIENPGTGIAALHAETLRLQQYLIGQGLLENSAQLPVHCFISAEHGDSLKRHCPDSEALIFLCNDISTVSRTVCTKDFLPTFTVDHLFVQMLMRRPPRVRFGNRIILKHYRIQQWQRVLDRCTIAALLCMLFLIPISLLSIHESHARESEAGLAIAELQRQQDFLDATVQTSGLNVEALHAINAQWNSIEKQSQRVLPSLQQVSHALPTVLELQRLEWRHETDEKSIRMDILLRAMPPSSHADIAESAEQFISALRHSSTDEIEPDMPLAATSGTDESGSLIRIRYRSRLDSRSQ